LLIALAIAALDVTSLADAAAMRRAKDRAKLTEQMSIHHGMMRNVLQDDWMGMSECERAMHAAATDESIAVQEQLQMRAEMMREIGRIVARYADDTEDEERKR
jgi:hypothetical protein